MAAQNFGRVNVSVTASTGGLTKGLSNASKKVAAFRSQIKSAFSSLVAPFAALATVGATVAAFRKAASSIDEAAKAASRLGVEVGFLQTLGAVASDAGVGFKETVTLIQFMNRNLGELKSGSSAATKAFGLLGLTFADLQGMSPEDQLFLITQRIAGLGSVAEQTAAAQALFGRAGAASLNLIQAVASGAYSEMRQLRDALGVTVTPEQARAVEMMNDAWERLGFLAEGFWNQLVSGVAPSITTVSNLIVDFFAKNSEGWGMASAGAITFSESLRYVTGTVTFLTGVWQTWMGLVQLAGGAFFAWGSLAIDAVSGIIGALARLSEAILGVDATLSKSLRKSANYVGDIAQAGYDTAGVYVRSAVENFSLGFENMSNPLGAFDAEMARVQEKIAQASKATGAAAGSSAGTEISKAISASSKALKAVLVGSSAGEEFRNSIARGADPRLEGAKEQARTADATERTAEGVDELNESLAGFGGIGLATISV